MLKDILRDAIQFYGIDRVRLSCRVIVAAVDQDAIFSI